MEATLELDQLLEKIAQDELNIASLKTQNSGHDFHEVAVWCLRNALKAAYMAGVKSAQQKDAV